MKLTDEAVDEIIASAWSAQSSLKGYLRSVVRATIERVESTANVQDVERDIAIAKAGAAECYTKAYTFGSHKRAFNDMGFDFAKIVQGVK